MNIMDSLYTKIELSARSILDKAMDEYRIVIEAWKISRRPITSADQNELIRSKIKKFTKEEFGYEQTNRCLQEVYFEFKKDIIKGEISLEVINHNPVDRNYIVSALIAVIPFFFREYNVNTIYEDIDLPEVKLPSTRTSEEFHKIITDLPMDFNSLNIHDKIEAFHSDVPRPKNPRSVEGFMKMAGQYFEDIKKEVPSIHGPAKRIHKPFQKVIPWELDNKSEVEKLIDWDKLYNI